jgi:hypothetical protein
MPSRLVQFHQACAPTCCITLVHYHARQYAADAPDDSIQRRQAGSPIRVGNGVEMAPASSSRDPGRDKRRRSAGLMDADVGGEELRHQRVIITGCW